MTLAFVSRELVLPMCTLLQGEDLHSGDLNDLYS